MTKARDLANSAAAFASVSATELGFVDGVTSAIQTQMDAKAPSSTAVTLTGTQTLTNKTLTSPVIASVINNTLTSTTGDIIYASAANTPARLGIGSSAQVLTVASGIPSWATASAGGMTLLESGTLSGSSTTSASLSQAHNNLFIVVSGITLNTTQQFGIEPNSAATSTDSLHLYALSDGSGQAGNSAADDRMNPFAFQNVHGGTVLNVCQFNIYNYASTTHYKAYESVGVCFADATRRRIVKTSGWFKSASAITTIKFTCVGSTTTTGQYLIYGVK